VLKTLLKSVGLLACVAWFNLASAATMGGINVMSALGSPLKAEISLAELANSDKSALVAKLASVNEFKSAGLDFPYSLPKLSFEVKTRDNGEAYIKLTSTQPVNEPFVSLLIELSWPSGKLLREYTFLLDPASFVPEQPKATEVKPVEPMVPVMESAAPAVVPVVTPAAVTEEAAIVAAEPVAAPMVEATVAAEPVPAEKVPAQSNLTNADMVAAEKVPAEPVLAEPGKFEPAEQVNVAPLATASQAAGTGSVIVEKGDTLGKIADEVKPVDVSLERMLVAMYRANAKKFDGKNMNRIRAGKILRMPEASEIEKVTQSAAIKEIRAQVADWQDYRQKLAAAQSIAPEQAPKQEVAGKISTAVAEKAPVAKESAKEVLRLSKGESLGDKAVTGSGATKKEKMIAKADDATAKSKQVEEEQKKLAQLENINKDVSKLVELKAKPVPDVAQAETPKPAVVTPPAKVPAATVAPTTAPASDDLDIMAMFNKYLNMVLEDPIIMAVVAAVVLGLGALGFVMMRRGKGGQKKTTKKNNEVGEGTGSWRTPVAPSPDTGDFTQVSANTSASAAPMSVAAALDDVDPISEADLFLNFGRDVQAEEILKDALSKNSSNVQIKLKLLSIYATRQDVKSFSKYAQEIKDSGDTGAWERAAVMGRDIDPGNPNYGGAKGEVRNRERPPAEVDFDLGLSKAGTSTGSNAVAAKDFKMDFDLTGSQSTVKESPKKNIAEDFSKTTILSKSKPSAEVDATSILSRADVQAAEAATPMDFDISGILPGEAKHIAETQTMDFDLSGNTKSSQSTSMDFDLSNNGLSASSSSSALDMESTSTALNFNDLVFEIPTSETKPIEERAKPAVDNDNPFSIDFPTSDSVGSTSGKSATSDKIDIDFGNININLGDDTPPVHAGGEGKDEQWHEVATKLDLAKAYQEMGDADGAREILEEVKRDGDQTQRDSAERLLQQITA
jgi:pilus assembly protein FimV